MKKFFLFLIFMFLILPVHSKIITGEVEYNAEGVRNEAFSTPIQNQSVNKLYNFYIDKNNAENVYCLQENITELQDRKLADFSDGTYGVQYYDDPLYSWYYSAGGRLINFTCKDKESYPHKIIKYKPDGSIANVGYRVSENESFIFNKEGKLLAHWLGDKCYDEYNNVIMTRKIYK